MNTGRKQSTWKRVGIAAAAVSALALGACAKKEGASPVPAVVLAESVRSVWSGADQARLYPVEVVSRYSTPLSFRDATNE
jgi:hypothetical protein